MAGARQRVGAYVVLVDGRQVLLVRAGAGETSAGRWYLPGGGVEFGEDPRDTAVRETLEETGYVIGSLSLMAVVSDTMSIRDVDVHSVRIIFEAVIGGGTLAAEADGSTDAVMWHPLDRLPEGLMPFVETALTSVPGRSLRK